MAEQTDYGPAGQPERLGLSLAALDAMWEPLRQAMSAKLIPGASAAVLYKGARLRYAGGLALDTPHASIPTAFDTRYDCASLTKVSVTLPLLLLLLDQGRLQLEDRVAYYLPAFDRPDKRNITIRHLMAHISGLPASYDFYTRPWSTDDIVNCLAEEPLAYETGTQCIYSDLGFILLGEIAVQLYGSAIEEAADRCLFGPLGMKDSGFCPDPSERQHIAATEYSIETGEYWHGIVHDENARARGGVSGHAGLFSTAGDLLVYAGMWLAAVGLGSASATPADGAAPRLLSARSAQQAIATQTPTLPGVNRGLGWVLKGDSADVSGPLFSPRSFGHTGFTGTSLYFDPQQDLAVVLLTNRVHYGRQQNITQLRTDFHQAVAAAVSGK